MITQRDKPIEEAEREYRESAMDKTCEECGKMTGELEELEELEEEGEEEGEEEDA